MEHAEPHRRRRLRRGRARGRFAKDPVWDKLALARSQDLVNHLRAIANYANDGVFRALARFPNNKTQCAQHKGVEGGLGRNFPAGNWEE